MAGGSLQEMGADLLYPRCATNQCACKPFGLRQGSRFGHPLISERKIIALCDYRNFSALQPNNH